MFVISVGIMALVLGAVGGLFPWLIYKETFSPKDVLIRVRYKATKYTFGT